MPNYWIIGGGKFGLQAAREIGKAAAAGGITIVEHNKAVCSRIRNLGYRSVCMDGIQYLDRNLISAFYPDWIVPAIPLHVAYEWIRAKLSATHQVCRVPVPAEVTDKLPNPLKDQAGRLYTSLADFKCPANCPEPAEICTRTGKPRSMILHAFLKTIQHPDFRSIVIRSHQLAPGVGGLKPEALLKALKQIETIEKPVLLSTACSCHGVMDAFQHPVCKTQSI
jgi:hypothetical protein